MWAGLPCSEAQGPLCLATGFWGTFWCLLLKTFGFLTDVLQFVSKETYQGVRAFWSTSYGAPGQIPEGYTLSWEGLLSKAELFKTEHEQHAELLQDPRGLASTAAWLLVVLLCSWQTFRWVRHACFRSPQILFFPDKSGAHVRHICYLMRAARRQVWVAMFALTDDMLAGELLSAFERRVDVRVIVDDEQCGMLGADAPKLLDAGVPLLIDSSPARMHHKFAIIDDCLLTGSFNWTKQASTTNWENVCILRDPAVIATYAKEFRSLWKEFSSRSQDLPASPKSPARRKRDSTPGRR